MTNVSVSFVCESGRLEAQAVLLAASLRWHHRSLRLVAAMPGSLPKPTRAALTALAVEQVAVGNPVAPDYPIGHKVAALGIGDPAGRRLFVDSDVLCLAPLPWTALSGAAFAAKPADLATFGSDALWQRLYARLGLMAPAQRVVASVSEQIMFPYFNAGVIATTEAGTLAETWASLCREVDSMTDIEPRRPWVDQVALPLALSRQGLDFRALGETWNYPAHIKHITGQPTLVHYHMPSVIRREPWLSRQVARLWSVYPAIRPVLEADEAWHPVIAAAKRRRRRSLWPASSGARSGWRYAHDLVITGLPRSGTSFLCRLLDSFDNAAVINEPQALFEGLVRAPQPWAVPLLHADLRACIDFGEAVENKLDSHGRLTEDTAVDEQRLWVHPEVRDRRWVLATKNTLAYMARLEGILRLMPRARVVVCVRHPLDTLASWKSTFAHLVQGDPTEVPVGGLADPYLPAHLRDGLTTLATVPDASVRRAAWWQLLAEELWRWRERVVILRYEDLVGDPKWALRQVLGPLWGAAGRAPALALAPSAVRTARRQNLESADYRAVQALCTDVAGRLGYTVDKQTEEQTEHEY